MIAAYLLPAAQTCQKHLIESKWLLCPSLRVGNQWKEQINLGGVNSVNLHCYTTQSLATDLAASELAKRGLKFAGAFQCSQIMALVVTKLAEAGKLSYFSDVQSTEQLAQLLAASLKDLRLAGLAPSCLSDSSVEVPAKAEDLRLIFESFVTELSERKLVDYAACLSIATKLVNDGEAALPSDLFVICPVKPRCAQLEAEFLESLKQKSTFIEPVEPKEETAISTSSFQSAVGEVNEIQIVLQQVFSALPGSSLDQIEILHTDYSTYVPLIHEQFMEHLDSTFNDIDRLPVTFGEGLACIYSRPGRALRSWLRWIRSDYLQASFVKIIREGLIDFDRDKDEIAIGFSSLAHRFRKLPIGFGKERYDIILADAIDSAHESIKLQNANRGESDGKPLSQNYDFGLRAFEQLNNVLGSLVKNCPDSEQPASELLASAIMFLKQFARSVNKFDNYALQKLLNDIRAMQFAIEESPELEMGVWDWLESLPVESRVLASGPRPGCVHIDHVHKGGYSGRPNTFVLGLDDSRFPYRGGQDPLLLDFERQAISVDLETSGARNVRTRADFQALLTRINGKATFTFAIQSLAADREQHPSSVLIETFRKLQSQAAASIDEFTSHLGAAASFCPVDDLFVSKDQWWQSLHGSQNDEGSRRESLEQVFKHFGAGRIAEDRRASVEFTQYDGLVPAAGAELDPSAADATRTSPSRLETFGACPRRFFFRYGLGIYPPDEHVVNHEQWLDALQLGSLLHEIFEDFLRELTTQNRIPEFARDHDSLLQLLHQKTTTLQQTIPAPNQDAYVRQIHRLEKTCEIFLRNEESHCRTTGSVPWILEASIGLGDDPISVVDCSEPVSIGLSDGRSIKVGGRVDRIDRIGGEGAIDFAI